MGDGVAICDPTNGDCADSNADHARYRFPALGDFGLSLRELWTYPYQFIPDPVQAPLHQRIDVQRGIKEVWRGDAEMG